MPSKAKNNGAAPLAQPPVRTLAVPEYLRPRIEAAHKRIEEDHPGGLSLQKLVEILILCGLEASEIETPAHSIAPLATASSSSPTLTRRGVSRSRHSPSCVGTAEVELFHLAR